MTFGMWRQKAHPFDSIRLLEEGKSVNDTALDCGCRRERVDRSFQRGTFGSTPGACRRVCKTTLSSDGKLALHIVIRVSIHRD
jgi:hypothetical protein